MALYLKCLNDTYTEFTFPYTIQDLKNDNPNVSFPTNLDRQLLSTFDVYEVQELDRIDYDMLTQNIEHGSPSLDETDEVYTEENTPDEEKWGLPITPTFSIGWVTTQKTSEIAQSNVRRHRNELLQDCDWTVGNDSPVNVTDWSNYRTQLRDITSQEGFPYSVTWPTKPS